LQVGILFAGGETGAGLVDVRKFTMTKDAGFRIIMDESLQQFIE
jgi:hypothetical protein